METASVETASSSICTRGSTISSPAGHGKRTGSGISDGAVGADRRSAIRDTRTRTVLSGLIQLVELSETTHIFFQIVELSG